MTKPSYPMAPTLGLTAFVASCGAATVPIPTLIGAAHDNEVAAYAKYRHETLRTTGSVTQVSVKTVARWRADVDTVQVGPFGSASGNVRRSNVPYPFVVLANGNSDGHLICFFTPDEFEDVAELRAGMVVTLSGRFQEYYHNGERIDAVFNHCELDD